MNREKKERKSGKILRTVKQSGPGNGNKGVSANAVPNDILVQHMSSTASGRLKKFEPLDTQDFIPFGDYDDVTIEKRSPRGVLSGCRGLI